jgi:tetratricopeptide (TPR) repeat protein
VKIEKRQKFIISMVLFLFIVLVFYNINLYASGELSPIEYHQLAAERLQEAALFYDRWQNNGDAESFQQAIVYAASAAEIRPDWDEPWLLLGMLYSEMKTDQGAMELAAEALINAVEVNPANSRAQMLLANVLLEQGRFYSVIEQYKSLFAKNEKMINGINITPLTIAYIADGRIEAGIIYLEELEELYPDNYSIRIGRAVLLKSSGIIGEARKVLNEILIDNEIMISLGSTYLSSIERNYILDLLDRWEEE